MSATQPDRMPALPPSAAPELLSYWELVRRLANAPDGRVRFVERTAKKGRVYRDIPLYEAEYQQERIQFYKPRQIAFVRELRKVALEYPVDGVPRPAAAASE